MENYNSSNSSSTTPNKKATATNPRYGYDYYSQESRQTLPTLQQLKGDLIGRKLTEPQPGYHSQN